MKQLVYKNTFEGVMSVFAFASDDVFDEYSFISEEKHDGSLSLYESVSVDENLEIAAGLADKIIFSAGRSSLKRVIRVYLSGEDGFESILFEYIMICLREGRAPDGWISNQSVRRVIDISDKVAGEIHRFTGLLRFRKLSDGTYYAPFEPDYDIAVPVSAHFKRRLKDQRWIIHDVKRKLAVVWDLKNAELIDLNEEENIAYQAGDSSKADELCVNCWKLYARTTAIEERKNPKLQKQNMPRRYWKFLTEMN